MEAETKALLERAYSICQRVSPRDIADFADFPAGAYLLALALSRMTKWQWSQLSVLVNALEKRLEAEGKP